MDYFVRKQNGSNESELCTQRCVTFISYPPLHPFLMDKDDIFHVVILRNDQNALLVENVRFLSPFRK